MTSSKQHAYTYRHPHPAVAVDIVVWTCIEDALQVLLIRRALEPFRGQWALPGGFLRMDEDLLAAAQRELREETGVSEAPLQQIGAFGRVNRDPRERVISVAYGAIVPADAVTLKAGTDAAEARWQPVDRLPPLAFDHADILVAARTELIESVRYAAAALAFMPPEFTLSELQRIYELVYGEALDKRNFRKTIEQADVVRATRKHTVGGRHRPALLYRARQ